MSRRRSKRYTVRATDYGCELWIAAQYSPRDQDETLEFACVGGYVYETTHNPGTSGRQVCESLFGGGPTVRCRPADLVIEVKRLVKRHCAAVDREWETLGA